MFDKGDCTRTENTSMQTSCVWQVMHFAERCLKSCGRNTALHTVFNGCGDSKRWKTVQIPNPLQILSNPVCLYKFLNRRMGTPGFNCTGICHLPQCDCVPFGTIPRKLCCLELDTLSEDIVKSKSFELRKRFRHWLCRHRRCCCCCSCYGCCCRHLETPKRQPRLRNWSNWWVCLLRISFASRSDITVLSYQLLFLMEYLKEKTKIDSLQQSRGCHKVCFDVVLQTQSVLNCLFQNSMFLLLVGQVIPRMRRVCLPSLQTRHCIALECRKYSAPAWHTRENRS